MKKNKLYTVNKFNKPLFAQSVDREKNILALGTPTFESINYKAPENFQELSSMAGADYKGLGSNIGVKAGGKSSFFSSKNFGADSLGGAALTTFAPVVGNALGSAFSGGRTSAAGSTVSSLGSMAGGVVGQFNPVLGAAISAGSGVLGGLVNNLFGMSTNEELLKAANASIDANKNYTSSATSFDDVKDDIASMTSTDVYSGGLFSSGKAERKNRELRERMERAYDWAVRSQDNNLDNLVDNQVNLGLANYASCGGWLGVKPFARKFADGGLSSAFIDEFGSNPIGAAIRYSRGLEQAAAEREAAEAQAAREAEYADMQNRLLRLETQNQGIQALMEAQSRVVPEVESPESSFTPSTATSSTSGGNWGYIESQLRNSGRFSDAQIQGIKYNLQRESGINPSAVGDNNSAFGLGQWHGARKPKDMSLEGQTRHLIDTLSNFDGKIHWLNKNDYLGFMNARTPEEAHYYITKGYERPRADIVAKVKRDSDMSLKHINAFGGELGTNGTDFTNGLLYINEGGTHEENPLDGVPMGLDPEGIPNLVEEGETVYNDYVFSNRLTVPDFMLKDLGLHKSKKKISFADASKKLSLESEKRPNDPISKAGLDASLARLAEIQETERIRNNAEEYTGLSYALGGNLFAGGGALEWLQKYHSGVGGNKDKAAIAKVMEKYAQKYKDPKMSDTIKYQRAWEAVSRGQGNIATPSRNYSKDDSYDRQRKHFNELVGAGLSKKVAFGLAFPAVRPVNPGYNPQRGKEIARYNEQKGVRDNLYYELVYGRGAKKANNTPATSTQAAALPQTKTPATQTKAVATPTGGGNTRGVKGKGVGATQGGGSTTFRSSRNPYGEGVTEAPAQAAQATQVDATGLPEAAWDYGDPEARQQAADYGFYDNFENDDFVEVPDNETPEGNNANPKLYPTWMRYAPVVGSGVAALSDMFGLTNKPDYTYADKLEAAASAAGYSPNIRYNPIGDYMRYRPMDIWAEQNQLNAQSRATDRALRNTTSPSRTAGIIANGYNSQLASGDLYRKALEYNDAQRERVADFNRKTNMFNSQMDLEAAMANARYTQTARQMGLSGLAQAAAMRDQIDARTSAARSANLTNFFNNLGNIGRENFAMNQINTDRSRNYFGKANGDVSGYKPRTRACGGKIKRK